MRARARARARERARARARARVRAWARSTLPAEPSSRSQFLVLTYLLTCGAEDDREVAIAHGQRGQVREAVGELLDEGEPTFG